MSGPVLVFERVSKSYRQGNGEVPALRGISFELAAGELLAVVGPSGSGKSTLLHLAGALDEPSAGDVWIGGRRLAGLGEQGRTLLRRTVLGFVFQSFNLLPTMSAMENVMMPAILAGVPPPHAKARARGLLDAVGLDQRADHRPDALSGGEMQRVAIARALVTGPSLLLADEPTGNLDTRTGEQIAAMLCALAAERGAAVAIVTHDMAVARRARRFLRLRDGKQESDLDASPA